jgi:hypothetical protein
VLLLGPMAVSVQTVIRRLVAEARPERPEADERLNGFLLTGGPGGCSFLDADGQVWNWSAFDESIDLVPDGPLKVSLVAIAADRMPELGAWLPSHPSGASDCGPCQGSGWVLPPLPRVLCPQCYGMGWLP